MHLPKPESPTFYTTRQEYYDQMQQLEKAIAATRGALSTMQLLPLPEFAREKLLVNPTVWQSQEELAQTFASKMTTARYRKIIALLNQLNELQRIALSAGVTRISKNVYGITSMFESLNKDKILNRGKRKPVEFDEYGRSYTVGRRKTSAARVWIIPVFRNFSAAEEQAAPTLEAAREVAEDTVISEPAPPPPVKTYPTTAAGIIGFDEFDFLGTPKAATPSPSSPTMPSQQKLASQAKPAPKPDENVEELVPPDVWVSTTTILVNNLPLAEYFKIPADRERVARPLKIAGVLGAYNVYGIARGGGTTGQSGALSQAIAKGLAAHEPQLAPVLRSAKLMRRDPRMVERKKTNRLKARSARTWVKR